MVKVKVWKVKVVEHDFGKPVMRERYVEAKTKRGAKSNVMNLFYLADECLIAGIEEAVGLS